MKTMFIIFITVLCNMFLSAQNSPYFQIKDKSFIIELSPKNVQKIEMMQPYNNQCWPINTDKLTESTASLVKDAFGNLNEDELEILKKVQFYIAIGPHFKVYSFKYTIPKNLFSETMKMEKKLYELSRKYMNRDMSFYFQAQDETLFHHIDWCIGRLDYLYKYTPVTTP